MNVYVAGSTKDRERVQYVQLLVRANGWTVAYDWTTAEGNFPVAGWDSQPDLGRQISLAEIEACRTADLVILLCPKGGLGCWIEMGAALASGAEVWVVDEQRDSVFWHHPHVSRLSFEQLMGELGMVAA